MFWNHFVPFSIGTFCPICLIYNVKHFTEKIICISYKTLEDYLQELENFETIRENVRQTNQNDKYFSSLLEIINIKFVE